MMKYWQPAVALHCMAHVLGVMPAGRDQWQNKIMASH
jgi:hypothetical protein